MNVRPMRTIDYGTDFLASLLSLVPKGLNMGDLWSYYPHYINNYTTR